MTVRRNSNEEKSENDAPDNSNFCLPSIDVPAVEENNDPAGNNENGEEQNNDPAGNNENGEEQNNDPAGNNENGEEQTVRERLNALRRRIIEQAGGGSARSASVVLGRKRAGSRKDMVALCNAAKQRAMQKSWAFDYRKFEDELLLERNDKTRSVEPNPELDANVPSIELNPELDENVPRVDPELEFKANFPNVDLDQEFKANFPSVNPDLQLDANFPRDEPNPELEDDTPSECNMEGFKGFCGFGMVNMKDTVSIPLRIVSRKWFNNIPIDINELIDGYEVRKAIKATETLLEDEVDRELSDGLSVVEIFKNHKEKVHLAANNLRNLLKQNFVITFSVEDNEVVVSKNEGKNVMEEQGPEINAQVEELKI